MFVLSMNRSKSQYSSVMLPVVARYDWQSTFLSNSIRYTVTLQRVGAKGLESRVLIPSSHKRRAWYCVQVIEGQLRQGSEQETKDSEDYTYSRVARNYNIIVIAQMLG